ncbi:hypothetical protein NQ318_023461 [Aromia moschata]|uniref:Maturase K n=1 Tax=Aromia moschata TaxID=1265417 RepID=A0AAV8YL92_9CUCU|nr:hypothetical protein NQ318_023461 [Aromia moschata]
MRKNEENPHWMRELHTHRPQKTNVWAGIIQDRIVGPFFFDDTLNGARYLRLLQHELMTCLLQESPSELALSFTGIPSSGILSKPNSVPLSCSYFRPPNLTKLWIYDFNLPIIRRQNVKHVVKR